MTRQQAIIDALNHKENDIVPFYAEFTGQEFDRMVKFTGNPDFENNLGVYMSFVQYYGWPELISGSNELYKDDFGVVWDRSGVDKDFGMIRSDLIADIEDNDYQFPKINEAKLRKMLEDSLANSGDKFRIAGVGFSMFERSWSLCGMENVMMAMLESPKELHELYDKIAEFDLSVIDIILQYPFDGVYFGDDWGQQKGQIMGYTHWRDFIKPRMKKLYDRVKKGGKFVLQHSCGDIEALMPDLIEIGLDCYQTVQPEIYDLEKIKREYGKDLSFWGGISTQRILPFLTPDQVKENTVRIMNTMKKGGGYIAAPTHAVPQDCPPENIMAMFEVFHNQKKFL